MSEKEFGPLVRQEFEIQEGLWKTRIVDFPTSYLRSRVFSTDAKYQPWILIFEAKQTKAGLTTLSESIFSSVDKLDELEAFLTRNSTLVRAPNSETTPQGLSTTFTHPLAPYTMEP